jgi:hypothetical protein
MVFSGLATGAARLIVGKMEKIETRIDKSTFSFLLVHVRTSVCSQWDKGEV